MGFPRRATLEHRTGTMLVEILDVSVEAVDQATLCLSLPKLEYLYCLEASSL